jgi:hypothetical protein
MTSREVVLRNKRRGRAWQARLAKRVGGMNVGTLGNEDVMHDLFSYEAKSSEHGIWIEKELDKLEMFKSLPLVGVPAIVVQRGSWAKEKLYCMRLNHWLEITVSEEVVAFTIMEFNRKKFVGYTWMDQATKNAPDGKLPVIGYHHLGDRANKDIAMVWWDSIEALLQTR